MTAWQQIFREVTAEGKRFLSDLGSPALKQEAVLEEILQNNSQTRFGLQHGFEHINSIQDYQDSVPVHSYEQMTGHIHDIANGEKNVLTSEPVIVFEETGGSTKGAKLIPYTASSLRAFQKALYPWLYDLLSNHQRVMQGSAYWSISPAMRKENITPADIPVGLQSDAEYFGPAIAGNILHTLAVPPVVCHVSEFDAWQYLTLRYLLTNRDLSLVSVWSPTYLLDLMAALSKSYSLIMDDVIKQKLSITLPEGLSEKDLALPCMDDARIAEIEAAFQGGTIDTNLLWPKLDTISCWLDANAAYYREQIECLFPNVYLQGKGLLATEGVVSIPLCNTDAAVLAINSGFFEFVDKEENIFLAHELQEDQTYRVLITTYSGFYRYDLGDQVMVTGYQDKTPLVKFTGRAGLVSDLCGEKLTESFVLDQLQDVKGYAMLLPYREDVTGYLLLLEKSQYSQSQAEQLVEIIEQRLCINPQYAYARKIGQLASLSTLRFDNIWDHYSQYQYDSGHCLGDIKPVKLTNDISLHKLFTEGKTITNRTSVCAR